MGIKLEMLQILLKRPSSDFKKHIKKEKIENQTIKYAQIDNHQPTVVFENGYGFGASIRLWDEVFLEIGKTNSVFAYDRNDKKDEKKKNVSTDRVEILRKLLLKRGLKPPYILVGHSLGGTYAQYFAKKYPDEVCGMILVDTSPPGSFEDTSTFPKLAKFFSGLYKEINIIDQEILALPTIHTPVSVIQATQKKVISQYKKQKPMMDIIHEKAKKYPILYPNCKMQWVDTGHVVMFEDYKLVSDAIKEVIEGLG